MRRYVGIPYERMNCWQLVAHVMQDAYGIPPPVVPFQGDPKTAAPWFIKYLAEWKAVPKPEPGDMVVFKIKGRPLHCGIVVQPWVMLHTLKGQNSSLENFKTSARWRNRIWGYYRWPL